jgi:hypothetical protein
MDSYFLLFVTDLFAAMACDAPVDFFALDRLDAAEMLGRPLGVGNLLSSVNVDGSGADPEPYVVRVLVLSPFVTVTVLEKLPFPSRFVSTLFVFFGVTMRLTVVPDPLSIFTDLRFLPTLTFTDFFSPAILQIY